MKANEVTHIEYTRTTDLGGGAKGEVTERYVIPTFIPHPNIKALDVTDLPEDARKALAEQMKEYAEYYRQQVQTIFSFEDWLNHTRNEVFSPKWRTFKVDNVKVLEE